ncbi:glutaredoxin 3 [Porticoccaceae bacterium LTM1]|nr:glutaredoxin 3 [Porticoccaceae bacterium LTM1]
MQKVTVYGTRFCPYCIAAKRLLEQKGVHYQDIPVDGNPQLRAEVMQRSGQRTVPQIWVGDTHVGGFDDLRRLEMSGQLNNLLEGLELA